MTKKKAREIIWKGNDRELRVGDQVIIRDDTKQWFNYVAIVKECDNSLTVVHIERAGNVKVPTDKLMLVDPPF